jgi:hypothetical protein
LAFAGVGAGLFDRLLTVDLAWDVTAAPPTAWRPEVSVSIHPLR